MTKKIALALAALITLASAVHAGDKGALTFGGGVLCSNIYPNVDQNVDPNALNRMDWILGYWSALNATNSRGGWVGEKLAQPGVLPAAAVVNAVLEECMRNPHETLQDAENTVYDATQAAGK